MMWRAMLLILLCLVVTGCAYTARTTQPIAQSVPVSASVVPAPQPAATAELSSIESQTVNGYHVWTD